MTNLIKLIKNETLNTNYDEIFNTETGKFEFFENVKI